MINADKKNYRTTRITSVEIFKKEGELINEYKPISLHKYVNTSTVILSIVMSNIILFCKGLVSSLIL